MRGPIQTLKWLATIPDRAEERSPYLILAVVCLAMFLDISNLSAVTIALPAIQTQFGTEQSQLQWVISAYALTFGSFLLLGGRGGDILGHRRILIFGLCLFALFTLVCALSPSFVGLVIGRAFQGIGAGFTIPSAQAHVAIHFPDPKARAKALGFWAASGSVGFIVGLILGGVLTALLSWRWIFWISLVVSTLVILISCLVLPRSKVTAGKISAPSEGPSDGEAAPEGGVKATRPGSAAIPEHDNKLSRSIKARLVRFDALGIVLGLPGLLLLTYALTCANTSGWGSARIVSTLVVAVVLLILFVMQENRASQALIDMRLFRNLSFDLTLVQAIVLWSVRQACTYFLTIQLQSYGNSALHTSLRFLPMGVTALLANSTFGGLVPVLGARFMLVLGWALCIPGVLLFSFITEESSYWRYNFPGLVLYIAGLSAVYVAANFIVVSSATKSDQGAVASVFNVALQVGGSVLGLAVITAVANGIGRPFAGGTEDGALAEIGYDSVYYSCIILCGIALALSLFAIKVPDSIHGTIWKERSAERHVAEPTAQVELNTIRPPGRAA